MHDIQPIPRRIFRNEAAPVCKVGASVTEHRLKNGMRILLAERHGDPVAANVLFYRVGSRNETEREAGVSHFLEHMMFKGSRRFGKGEVDRLTTELGGQNNAFTGYDHTAYWFEFASDRWEHALDIEADRMQSLTLDSAEFDAERAVILEELAMGEDDPWRHLSRPIETMLFSHHPYGRPIIGFSETLSGMTPESLRDYHRRFYHPANATLVVSGDIRPRPALKAIRDRFGSLEAGVPYEQADCFRRRSTEPRGEVRVTVSWDDAAHRLIMAWPTVKCATPEDYACDLILTVLTGGRMSRMYRRLVLKEGLATSVSGANDARVEAGAFWLYAEAAQGVEPAVLERAIDEELVKLAQDRVAPEELKRAKAIMHAADAFDGEAVSDVAEELGEWAVDADWHMAFDGGKQHDRITAEKLRRTAAEYLRHDRRIVGWCHPKD
jgi:zinc protease